MNHKLVLPAAASWPGLVTHIRKLLAKRLVFSSGTHWRWLVEATGSYRLQRVSGDTVSEMPLSVFQGRVSQWRRCQLVWPASMVMQRDLVLPAAARENLAEALRYELDRHTPFHADQVYFDYQMIAEDSQAGLITIRLCLVRRGDLDPVLAELQRYHFVPRSLHLQRGGLVEERPWNMLPGINPRFDLGRRRFNSVMTALALCLVIAIPIVDQVRNAQVLGDLSEKVQQLRPQAEAAAAVQRRLQSYLASVDQIVALKEQRMATIELLAEISRLLPQDTWLERFEISGNELRIYGNSVSAAQLIGLLDASPLLTQVEFRSPVTQHPQHRVDRFQIIAQLEKAKAKHD